MPQSFLPPAARLMTTPLKALIQERLRAKIVRQGDEDDEVVATTPRQRHDLECTTEHATRSGDRAHGTNSDQEVRYSPQAQTSYAREDEQLVRRRAPPQRRAHSPIKSFHFDTDGWRRRDFEHEHSNQDDTEFYEMGDERRYDRPQATDHPILRKNYDLTEHYERYRNYNKREYARIAARSSVTQHRSPRHTWGSSHSEAADFTPYDQYDRSASHDHSDNLSRWTSPHKRPLSREPTPVLFPRHHLPPSPIDNRRYREESVSNQHDISDRYHRFTHHHDELPTPKLYLPPVTRPSPSEYRISRPASRVEYASEQLGRIRVYDETLSPESRQAAKDFVAKRQRRSGQTTPRTMATQRWLQSLNNSPNRESDGSRHGGFYPIDLSVVRASPGDNNKYDSGRPSRHRGH